MKANKMNQIHSEFAGIESSNMTIDDLIRLTEVDVFDPRTFKGYQREINEKHVSKIEKYILEEFEKGNFLFPSPIICSLRENEKMYIVDGQHRVQSFKNIKYKYKALYDRIKDYEVNIITLIKPTIKLEVETFITINKTSKKVDTSLALIAKTLYSDFDEREISARKQYILVEIARKLDSSKDSNFYDNIAWEGTPRATGKLISLNSFVRAYMPIVNYLNKKNLIDLNNLTECIDLCIEVINTIWNSIENKWPQLFRNNWENSIIQGTIGSSAIVKFINSYLKEKSVVISDMQSLLEEINIAIKNINCSYENWLPYGSFASYSSGAGHTIISRILLDSIYY
jgi:DGQHR domain